MSWNECIEDFNAIKITPDKERAKSLTKTAKARLEYIRKQKVTNDNCSFIFEAYYSSVLECLHALMLNKGYKVKNHVCIGYYLRDELKRSDLYNHFDTNRKRRNSLIYDGKMLDIEISKKSIKEIKKIIEELDKFGG